MRMQLFETAERVAKEEGLDPYLIMAIIMVESSGNNLAVRYEDHWRYFNKVKEYADDLNITEITEKRLQMMSWGCMQVMGSVAREHGFRGHLTQIAAEPELAIRLGCKHFRGFLKRYGNIEDAVASYNAGSPRKTDNGLYYHNQGYVDKVMTRFKEVTALKSTKEEK